MNTSLNDKDTGLLAALQAHFSGNINIDLEGERKITYHYTLTTSGNGTISLVLTDVSESDGLYKNMYWDYKGLDKYTWHDYSINKVKIKNENGKVIKTVISDPFEIDYSNPKAKTSSIPFEWVARLSTGEYNWMQMGNEEIKGTKDLKIFEGGIRFTTRNTHQGVGSFNKFNATGGEFSESINIDDLINAIGIMGGPRNSPKGPLEVVEYFNHAVDVSQKIKSTIKNNKSIKHCISCKQNYKDTGSSYEKTKRPASDTIKNHEYIK